MLAPANCEKEAGMVEGISMDPRDSTSQMGSYQSQPAPYLRPEETHLVFLPRCHFN